MARVHAKPVALRLAFPRAKSLTSLSNSLKGEKKRKGPEMTGVGDTLPGHRRRAPPDRHPPRWQNPRPVLCKEQQSRKAAERSPAGLCSDQPSLSEPRHPAQPPSRRLEEAPACLRQKASPKPCPAPSTIASHLVPGVELSWQPGSSSRSLTLLYVSTSRVKLNEPRQSSSSNRTFQTEILSSPVCKDNRGRQY